MSGVIAQSKGSLGSIGASTAAFGLRSARKSHNSAKEKQNPSQFEMGFMINGVSAADAVLALAGRDAAPGAGAALASGESDI